MFDIEAALTEGYSTTEIAEYLAEQNEFDLESARGEGYSDDEISAHLAEFDQFETTPEGQQIEFPSAIPESTPALGESIPAVPETQQPPPETIAPEVDTGLPEDEIQALMQDTGATREEALALANTPALGEPVVDQAPKLGTPEFNQVVQKAFEPEEDFSFGDADLDEESIPVQKGPIQDVITETGKTVVGGLEAGSALVGGAISFIPSISAGAGELVKVLAAGEPLDDKAWSDALAAAGEVGEKLTYKPKTEKGQEITEFFAMPFTEWAEGWRKLAPTEEEQDKYEFIGNAALLALPKAGKVKDRIAAKMKEHGKVYAEYADLFERMESIKERGLTIPDYAKMYEDLKAKGFSEGEIARMSEDLRSEGIRQRMKPEEAIPEEKPPVPTKAQPIPEKPITPEVKEKLRLEFEKKRIDKAVKKKAVVTPEVIELGEVKPSKEAAKPEIAKERVIELEGAEAVTGHVKLPPEAQARIDRAIASAEAAGVLKADIDRKLVQVRQEIAEAEPGAISQQDITNRLTVAQPSEFGKQAQEQSISLLEGMKKKKITTSDIAKSPEIKAIHEKFMKGVRLPYDRALIIERIKAGGPAAIERTKSPEKTFSSLVGRQALSERVWDVKAPSEKVAGGKTIHKKEIINFTETAFGVPIRSKLTHGMKKIAGFYAQHPEIIRLQKWGDLPVVAHEVAHHMDKKLEQVMRKMERGLVPGKKKWRAGPAGERAIIQKELGDLDYNPRARRTSEGFAEYMRYLLTTEDAAQKAPRFHKFFTEVFLKENPDFKGNIDKLKEMMDTWQKQGAEGRMLAQIDFKGETMPGMVTKIQKAKNFVVDKFFNSLAPFEKVTAEAEKKLGKDIPPSRNPGKMATYMKKKARGFARTFVEKAAIDEYGNPIGKSLTEILAPITKDAKWNEFHTQKKIRSFIAYAVAQRARLLQSRGIESGFLVEDINFVIDKFKNETWDKAIIELTEWSNHLLDWLVKAGDLSKAESVIIRKMNPIYLPFKRVFDDVAGVSRTGTGFVDTGKALKRITGSGRPIVNPIESLIEYAENIISRSFKTKLANLVVDLKDIEGMGKWVSAIPLKTTAKSFPLNKIKSDFKDVFAETIGNMGEDVKLPDNWEEAIDWDRILTVFDKEATYFGKENVVSVWRNGKRELYEIHPELYGALKEIDYPQLTGIIRVLAPFARMVRLGATGLKASFSYFKNPARDFPTYAIYSQKKFATPLDPLKAAASEAAEFFGVNKFTPEKGTLIWRMKAAGGEMSTMLGYDRAAYQTQYDELLLDNLGKIGKALKVVRHPIDALRRLFQIPELLPRIVEAEGVHKKLEKEHPEWTEEDLFVEAFNAWQDVTVNFTRGGKWSESWNQATAFFNVAFLGPEKFARSMKNNPMRTLIRGLAWLTIPALVYWNENKDKEWYKNLPTEYKYTQIFVETKEGVVKIPLPFEMGLFFAGIPVAYADQHYNDDKKAIDGAITAGIKNMTPGLLPNALGPIYDIKRNRNWLDQPIESMGERFLPVQQRQRFYTTQAAIEISKAFGLFGVELSPVQADFLLDQYSGGFSRQLVNMAPPYNQGFKNAPIIGDVFLKIPEKPTRQLNEFYSVLIPLRQKRQGEIISERDKSKLEAYEAFVRGTLKNSRNRIKLAQTKGDLKAVRAEYERQATKLNKFNEFMEKAEK